MACETCTYQFECEHADRYYMPGVDDIGDSESLATALGGDDDRCIDNVPGCSSKREGITEHENGACTSFLKEIQVAKKALIEAQQALDYADEDFIETAVYQLKMAETRFNAILKRLKKENSRNNIVQFPMQLQEEDKEAQPVWFDGLGWLTALLAVAIGVAVLIAQLGKW